MLKKGVLFCGLFLLAIFFSRTALDTAATSAQITAVPIDCSSMSSPILGFEISKGQDPDDVSAFWNNMETLGYTIGTVDISGGIPACVDVLIVHGLANNALLTSFYSGADATLLKDWVALGHGLMLAGDWGEFNAGTQALFNTFGYDALGGVIQDDTDHDPTGAGSSWIIYQTDNFVDHPILSGIDSLQFQLGGWLSTDTQAIVTADADANPSSVPVMAAFEQGAGCVTLTMDSNWYATDNNNGGYIKEDNAQAARQMVSWLMNCAGVLTAVSGGPYFVDEGSSISLDGSQSFDPNGQPITYSWDFNNDGQFDDATGVAPSFSAASLDDGIYPISIRVVSSSGGATHNSTVTVQNVAPDVSLLADSLSVQMGTAVNFSGSFTDPGVLDTHDLLWNFGDGTTPTADPQNTAHIFTQAGTYQTILTVTDDDGGVGQSTLNINVWIPGSGYALFLPVILNNYCADQSTASDIILAIDSSKSMLEQMEPNGPTKLTAAQEAAVSFLELLDFANDQAGVVSFDRTAVLQHPLSNNQSSLVTAVNGLRTDYETRIDLALIESHAELVGSRHLFGNVQVIILLTDGRPWGVGETAVIAAAANAKADGITIYTIGLGQNVNATLLEMIATTPNLYYFAPSTADLEAIYAQIATNLPCSGS